MRAQWSGFRFGVRSNSTATTSVSITVAAAAAATAITGNTTPITAADATSTNNENNNEVFAKKNHVLCCECDETNVAAMDVSESNRNRDGEDCDAVIITNQGINRVMNPVDHDAARNNHAVRVIVDLNDTSSILVDGTFPTMMDELLLI